MSESDQPRDQPPPITSGQFVQSRPLGSPLQKKSPAAKFTAKQAYHGFDGRKPQSAVHGPGLPWQMVPLDGARGVLLLNGPKLNVYSLDPEVADLNEVSLPDGKKREFWIRGKKKGKTIVFAEGPGTVLRLNVEVCTKLELKLGFYRLIHKTDQTNTTCSQVKIKILPKADDIYRLQANIHLKHVRCKDLKIPNDFGDKYRGRGSKIILSELLKVLGKKNWPNDEDASVILVPTELEIDHSQKEDLGGYYAKSIQAVILEDLHPLTKMGKVLAHELGHHLLGSGHLSDSTNLMVQGTHSKPGSIGLNKGQILTARSNV